MENLDIFILTLVVVVAFVIFIISTVKELSQMKHEPYQTEKESGYSRAALFKVLGALFEDDKIPKKHRVKFKNTLQSTMSDMESNGVYFDGEGKKFQKEDRVKKKKKREDKANRKA
ncbi:hypothetical protein P872_09335 [Rhodonellum psychrophilum GCM71 = DSM 17998]|uniref:Uncharacterized protein n=2 Tax=Rhodonellum TaxID=336827 RepID=U5BZU1_9BACT|nr:MULTISPECIES: hypothetical protein [Rhodonellum]ERM81412.1 hypothetical protein P872_09335 [Rhodonellum psychrophilum GCM71 = DSM 17998]MDO9551737.1 hypothetical protein [Rhodonellum sp.]SDZ56208.1 hypothetical protein SAMN05444412_1252 [Rhodonellum ikkaensis]